MNIQISEHFTYGKLLRFTLPSIVMMAFSSIYGVVDGVFVSNFAGAEAFAAVNLIIPFLMILGAVGFMLALAAARWFPSHWGRAMNGGPTRSSPC